MLLTAYCLLPTVLSAQQPQAQAGQAIFPVNAKFVQGFGPGYWPTAGSNLTLNLAPGTAVCSNTVQTYAGGTLTLAASATNYVYLNTANNCAPASNTTGFTSATIPIARVVTTSTAISAITDVRTMFVSNGASNGGTVTSVGMAGDGIIFGSTVSGSPVTSSGTLAPQLLTQTANTVLAGPGSAPAATPTFRALAPADLPATISSNTTGNAATASALAATPTQCGSNNWATGISTSGNANCLQPGFSNLGGTAAISQGGTGQTTASAAFNTLSPLSTEGDLLYYHSSANARLAAGGNGQCLISNGTNPVWGSCSGSSSFAWSSLVNPAANLTLSMSTFATTFNHTSAANWTWANTTAATSGTAQSSPIHNLSGTYWTGAASATDSWSFQDVVANGTNGNSTLTLTHTGSTGTATLSVPNLTETSTTQYGVLYGGGSSSPVRSTAAGTSGLPLLGQGSAAPVFGTLGIAGGGTGQTTANAGFNALSPLTTEGDLLYFHSSANTRLARGSNGQCLTSNGTDPVWGSCGSGGGSSSDLGNGTTVIDASLQAGADFSSQVNAAIAACSPGPCVFDLRGFSGYQTMSQNITFPQFSDVYMPMATITRNAGIQFILSNNVHIHGPLVLGGTVISSANQTTDYSAVFYASSQVHNVEIDHITVGPTTPSGGQLPVTSVATSSGGTAVYTGTITGGASNAFAGYWFEVKGFKGADNEGYFLCTASTATSLTLANANASAETPTPGGIAGGTYAVQAGGWGIWAPFMGANLHDLTLNSDLGINIDPLGGCSCYNNLVHLNLNTAHGALYFGKGANSGQGNNIMATGNDQVNSGFSAATGYGLWINNATAVEINGIEIENTKYSAFLNGHWLKITNLQVENDYTIGQGPNGAVSLPTIQQGSSNVTLDPSTPVLDYSSATTKNSNVYGFPGWRNVFYGSMDGNVISNPQSNVARAVQGSGSIPIQYWAVPIDFNGNKALPLSMGTPLNQALGPYTLTLTQATNSASSTIYTGTITGGNSGGLNGDVFTISGFTNPGNNGTFPCPTSTATTLTCNNANGVNETASATAASDAYNSLDIDGQLGVWCYDILKGDTSHSLALCMNPMLFPFYDDGTTPTVGGYSAPSRNATGDANFAGALSTAKNVLDDGSGNITAFSKMTAPQFCVGSNCVTSLLSNPLTTLGDLLYGGASGAATRLAIGANGQCLTSNGTNPVWGSCDTFQVNGTNTSNQTTINFINGTYLTASNPSAGQVKFDITNLPTPTASTLGGIESIAQTAHNWIQYIDTTGGPHLAQPAVSDLSDGVTGSGAVVLQSQPVFNGFSLQQFAGLSNPGSVALADQSGSGSLAANTDYYYQCTAFNLIGVTVANAIVHLKTANDGQSHKIQATCPSVANAAGYAFYGRTNSNNPSYITSCTGAATPVSQCTSVRVFVDDGALTASGITQAASVAADNTTAGIGFGPPSGSPSGNSANPTLNDVWLTRYAAGMVGLIASGGTNPCLAFGYGQSTSGTLCWGNGVPNFALSTSLTVPSLSATTSVAATTFVQSGVRTAVLSGGNATATCDLNQGNTCWIKPVGGTNITTLTVTNLKANGVGYDFCVLQDGTGGSTVTFASAPFHGAWAPGTTASKTSCAHFSSPDGTNLFLTGSTNNQ